MYSYFSNILSPLQNQLISIRNISKLERELPICKRIPRLIGLHLSGFLRAKGKPRPILPQFQEKVQHIYPELFIRRVGHAKQQHSRQDRRHKYLPDPLQAETPGRFIVPGPTGAQPA